MERPHVLYADDDREAHQLVRTVLESADIRVTSAYNGREALDIWTHHLIDLFILDWAMPVMDGLQTLRHIRLVSEVPVILLTVRGEEADIAAGYEAGANDYLVKPFLPGEFLARVKARLQWSMQSQADLSERMKYQDVVLELEQRRVLCHGHMVELSKMEFQVLAYLFSHAGMVVSKQELAREVWGYSNGRINPNLIEAVVTRLRRKFRDLPGCSGYLQTVHGAGYRFVIQELD
jgi:DNA-binding response OmpR family regulator